MNDVTAIPVRGIPEIRPGDDLVPVLRDAIRAGGVLLQNGDIVAVTQKIVSKAEGRVVPEGPGGRDAWVALETRRVVARRDDMVVAETRHGFVCANAGVDRSNAGAPDTVVLLPLDPDASAARIRDEIAKRARATVAVVITDTFGRAWREGHTNVAIGIAGLPALKRYIGQRDPEGYELRVTEIAVADEIAAAAELVMGKLDRCPVAIVRGLSFEDSDETAQEYVRPAARDMFR